MPSMEVEDFGFVLFFKKRNWFTGSFSMSLKLFLIAWKEKAKILSTNWNLPLCRLSIALYYLSCVVGLNIGALLVSLGGIVILTCFNQGILNFYFILFTLDILISEPSHTINNENVKLSQGKVHLYYWKGMWSWFGHDWFVIYSKLFSLVMYVQVAQILLLAAKMHCKNSSPMQWCIDTVISS